MIYCSAIFFFSIFKTIPDNVKNGKWDDYLDELKWFVLRNKNIFIGALLIVLAVPLWNVTSNRNACEKKCLDEGYSRFIFVPASSGKVSALDTKEVCRCVSTTNKKSNK